MSLTVAAAAAVVVDHTSINNIYLNILSACINEECLSGCVSLCRSVCVCVFVTISITIFIPQLHVSEGALKIMHLIC